MKHVVLLGDSIFDNGAYVAPAPDVTRQLRDRLLGEALVSLCAVDGHVTADVCTRQLARLPADATHLIVSVGGNDALRHASILNDRADSVADAVGRLATAQSAFAAGYNAMMDAVLAPGIPAAVCTIYDANFPDPQRRLVVAALALFNDVISRAAFARGVPLIDLRLICSDPSDYANPIEPSASGGDKIAAVIAALVRDDPAERPHASIWI